MSAVAFGEGRAAPGMVARLARLRRAWLSMDANPAAIRYARTPVGRLTIHAGLLIALAASMQLSLAGLAMVTAALAGCLVLPRHRLQVLVGASLVYVFMRPFRTVEFTELVHGIAASGAIGGTIQPMLFQGASVAAFLALAYTALEAQRRWPASAPARRPVLAMLVAFFATVGAGAALPTDSAGHAAIWTLVAIWASCFWFLAYALADQRAKDRTPNALRAAYMRPFWGGDAVPFGKGHAYLARFDAKDDDDLAATRLKAVKLAVWAAILAWLHVSLDGAVHGWAAVPRLDDAILMQVAGQDAPLAMRWASLVTNYFLDLVIIAVWGHALVAVIRMAGWRIPRNTVNPLASRSLAEFWNRYYFYFKELVVDFFFYPAFLRWFKKSPKLRIAFATFFAAGLGNFIYHFMRETHVFAGDFGWETLSRFLTYAVYTLLLSIGLIISQLRGRKPVPADGFWRYEFLPRLNVMAFFCLIKVFDDIFGIGTLADRFIFLVRLSGVS